MALRRRETEHEMRFLHSNSDYFAFLDSLDGEFSQHPNLASMALAAEYPVLRTEEAKAIYCDWRSAKHARHPLSLPCK